MKMDEMAQSGYPLERIAADKLGELPVTKGGYKYSADYYAKWTESFAMPNMEAFTYANIIESKLCTEMCSILDKRKHRTTPYYPQPDGMVEKFNRTLTIMNVEKFCQRQPLRLG